MDIKQALATVLAATVLSGCLDEFSIQTVQRGEHFRSPIVKAAIYEDDSGMAEYFMDFFLKQEMTEHWGGKARFVVMDGDYIVPSACTPEQHCLRGLEKQDHWKLRNVEEVLLISGSHLYENGGGIRHDPVMIGSARELGLRVTLIRSQAWDKSAMGGMTYIMPIIDGHPHYVLDTDAYTIAPDVTGLDAWVDLHAGIVSWAGVVLAGSCPGSTMRDWAHDRVCVK